MSLYDDAVAVLTRWVPPSAEQEALRSSYLTHLRERPDGLRRSCSPDHLTASALVISEDRERVLLNLHGKYAIWVQFGGHFEAADETLSGAALREAVEESGIAGLRLASPEPVQLSRHEVRCGPVRPSHHLDVRYVATAPPNSLPATSHESLDVRWFPLNALPGTLEPELHTLIRIAATL